tara:strand:+ start:527 stop:1237 length:711 start_codon:yes stop_codon:yes gene_type:complete
MGDVVPGVAYLVGFVIALIVLLSVGPATTAVFIYYWIIVALLLILLTSYSSRLSLGTFYRTASSRARRVQHLTATVLSVILLSNPVAVSVQYAAVQPDGSVDDIYPLHWWILLQAAYFVFLSYYTSACLELQRTGGTPACSAICCSTRDWIVLSVIFAAFAQVSALIVVATEYVDGNPLFPVWLVVFQSVWTAWAVVYDWIIHLAVCSCCGADHWSVVITDRGRLGPDEDLSVQLL